jgi:alpha-L-rhamnosidase
MPGWNNTGFDDSQMAKAELVEAPGGRLEAQMNEPIKVMDTGKALSA